MVIGKYQQWKLLSRSTVWNEKSSSLRTDWQGVPVIKWWVNEESKVETHTDREREWHCSHKGGDSFKKE